MGTPKAPQSLPWTPPRPSEGLENELLDVENLHFSVPRLMKTQKITENIMVLATHPDFAKITLKSNDSGHFWADPCKICFLHSKTGFWPPSQNCQNLCQNLSILGTFGPILGKYAFWTQKLDFGHPPRISKIHIEICGCCALLSRSWENLFFGLKNLILATHPKLAKFVSKSMDSGHFWADPGKICFLEPKT